MLKSGRHALQLVAVAAAGSQAGHLVAYQARFGGSALALERTGAHAYFLPAATGLVGTAAALGLASLLLIGWARLFAGRRLGFATRPGWRVLDALPLLFALQLAIYAGQESVESLAAGVPPAPALELLLWGALGQLPVACAGALALAWISSRLEGALEAVDIRLVELRSELGASAPLLAPPPAPTAALLLAQRAGAALAKRGPPGSS
jgi:hypothetical protein